MVTMVDSGLKPTVKTFHEVTGTRIVEVHHDVGVMIPKLNKELRRGV